MEQTTAKRNPGGHPRKYKTADDMHAAIETYWAWLDSNPVIGTNKQGLPVNIRRPAYWGRLLLHIGLDYNTAAPYVNGEYDGVGADNVDHGQYSDVLARARQRCEAEVAEGSMAGQLEARTAIAAMQQHHNWAERSEQTITGTVTHQLDDAAMARLWDARQARLSTSHQDAITVDCEPVS